MVNRLTAALAVALLALAATSCSGGGEDEPDATVTPIAPTAGQLDVRAFEWGFEPEAIQLTEGEQVTLNLQNDGRILHNFKVDDIEADVLSSESSGPLSADEGQVFVGADGGAGGTMELIPLAAGSYTFYCTISGHRQLGMEGTLIVKPSS